MGVIIFIKRREARSIEVDLVVMHKIRILTCIHSASSEIDQALLLVDFIYAAHDPFAFGDLVLDCSGCAVVKVDVVPTVPF